jgi:hypothetical protein
MFTNLFQALLRRGVPVTLNEWLLLQDALARNLAGSSLERFYHLARAILVKSEAHFDRYDQAFLECFRHIESTDELVRMAEAEMLRLPPLEMTEEEMGQGSSRQRSAVKIAERRAFRNYRDDVVLDTRSMKMALSYLRRMMRDGPRDHLDLAGTIDATCRNAGELELVWERERKRKIKLMLLMDAGGTMTPHAEIVSRLFSAAKDLVRELRFYYFHNCVYQDLYTDIAQRRSVPTRQVLQKTDRSFKVILVGDAYMAPSELESCNGAIDYWYRNDRPGIEWLTEIRRRFKRSIWLNPEPPRSWSSAPTTEAIRRIFPMYELTLLGLRAGARALIR